MLWIFRNLEKWKLLSSFLFMRLFLIYESESQKQSWLLSIYGLTIALFWLQS